MSLHLVSQVAQQNRWIAAPSDRESTLTGSPLLGEWIPFANSMHIFCPSFLARSRTWTGARRRGPQPPPLPKDLTKSRNSFKSSSLSLSVSIAAHPLRLQSPPYKGASIDMQSHCHQYGYTVPNYLLCQESASFYYTMSSRKKLPSSSRAPFNHWQRRPYVNIQPTNIMSSSMKGSRGHVTSTDTCPYMEQD